MGVMEHFEERKILYNLSLQRLADRLDELKAVRHMIDEEIIAAARANQRLAVEKFTAKGKEVDKLIRKIEKILGRKTKHGHNRPRGRRT